jgi:hypothetical protein
MQLYLQPSNLTYIDILWKDSPPRQKVDDNRSVHRSTFLAYMGELNGLLFSSFVSRLRTRRCRFSRSAYAPQTKRSATMKCFWGIAFIR